MKRLLTLAVLVTALAAPLAASRASPHDSVPFVAQVAPDASHDAILVLMPIVPAYAVCVAVNQHPDNPGRARDATVYIERSGAALPTTIVLARIRIADTPTANSRGASRIAHRALFKSNGGRGFL